MCVLCSHGVLSHHTCRWSTFTSNQHLQLYLFEHLSRGEAHTVGFHESPAVFLEMIRPLHLSACCLRPYGDWNECPLKVKVFAHCCIPNDFTFTIWCLFPSAPRRLSLLVTFASLAGWAQSSGGALMEERGTDMQPLGLQWNDVIGSSANKGIFFLWWNL